jgi:hypothetical protein
MTNGERCTWELGRDKSVEKKKKKERREIEIWLLKRK